MAQTPCVQWGTITLVFDNEAFRKGLLAARQWYFQDMYGEDGRPPEEPPQHAVHLTSETVLRLVVMPDEQGRYHLDEMGYENLASIPGVSGRRAFVAHLPHRRQSITAKSKPNRNIFVGMYLHSLMRDGTASLFEEKHATDHHC